MLPDCSVVVVVFLYLPDFSVVVVTFIGGGEVRPELLSLMVVSTTGMVGWVISIVVITGVGRAVVAGSETSNKHGLLLDLSPMVIAFKRTVATKVYVHTLYFVNII